MNSSSYDIKPIAILHSPFKQKFGIPRQSGLIKSTLASIELLAPYNTPDSVKGLTEFSHIWISFKFHQNSDNKFRPLVRPPRLGGNEKTGVFASRSSFRPNGLGLTVVALKAVKAEQGKIQLEVSCPDILDGTPIFDIKPYIAYSDSIPNAVSGFAPNPPQAELEVEFTENSQASLTEYSSKYGGTLQELIIETLAYDPRPAYKPDEDAKEYAIHLYDLNIVWKVCGKIAHVIKIENIA